MSCNRQPVAAAICGFVETVTGEKVTQADWHGIVALAKEDGYRTGRSRLDIHSTINALRALGKSEDKMEAAEQALVDIGYSDEGRAGMEIHAIDGKFPTYTNNMAAAVRYMENNGVKASLDRVRGIRQSKAGDKYPISDEEIQQRMILRSPSLGKEYEPYEYSITGPDIVSHDVVWARSKMEAQRTASEWAVRFKGQTVFNCDVNKMEPEDESISEKPEG